MRPLVALIASLLSAAEKSGGELLVKGATIWGTNVITFGLLFWQFDRRKPDPPPRGFQFPQGENPTLAEPDWHPRWADYGYGSFTNAIAFSPTDGCPLARPGEDDDAGGVGDLRDDGAVSVAARAVNILPLTSDGPRTVHAHQHTEESAFQFPIDLNKCARWSSRLTTHGRRGRLRSAAQ